MRRFPKRRRSGSSSGGRRFGALVHAMLASIDLDAGGDAIQSSAAVHGRMHGATQEEIQAELGGMEHVKQLVQSIKTNKGLIDPVIVLDETFIVLEGNSRLAAYRILAESEGVAWAKIKVKILPKDIGESAVTVRRSGASQTDPTQ